MITSAPCRQSSSTWSLESTSQGSESHGSKVSLQGPTGTSHTCCCGQHRDLEPGEGKLHMHTLHKHRKEQTKMCLRWLWHQTEPSVKEGCGTSFSSSTHAAVLAVPLGAEGPQGRGCSLTKRFTPLSQSILQGSVKPDFSFPWLQSVLLSHSPTTKPLSTSSV